MKIENNKIYADDGYVLTQNKDIDVNDRLLVSELTLGKYDNVNNWKEISIEEAEIIRKEIEDQ